MTPPIPTPAGAPASAADTDALIARYGIVRVAVEHFDYGGYRYSSLDHAVAEAKRRQPEPERDPEAGR